MKRAAVIGAGVMGGGIAAHLANAGMPVLLLDLPGVAATALEKLQKADPAPFMTPEAVRLVTPGSVETDIAEAATADWLVEAVPERLGLKQQLYGRLEPLLGPQTILSSNTSTIPLAKLVEGQSSAFRRRFLITHFFNPPRYMRLLELVTGPDTDPAFAAAISDFADRRLGKGVVPAKDTPGFIANRIGTFWIESAVNAAFELGLSVEEADAIAGPAMGVPKTGVFGLADLIGIDLLPQVAASLLALLAPDDPYRALHRDQPLIAQMIAEGRTGRKGKGGFYRLTPARVKEGLDLATGAYRPSTRVEPPKDLGALLARDDRLGRFARAMLGGTLGYAASLVPEIADDIVAVDRAMQLGYAWAKGPFELIDQIGAARVAELVPQPPPLLRQAVKAGGFYRVQGGRLQALAPGGGYADVQRPPGVVLLADIKRAASPVQETGSAALWDLGDGVTGFELRTKMNTLDEGVLKALGQALAVTAKRFKAMVIYGEADNFSVGANLGLVLFAANIALWPALEAVVKAGQDAFKALKYAPLPVVGAPAGMALGGGCELLLHCAAIQAHAETYIGLVETGVGLIPGWGGNKEMLLRLGANPKRPGGPMPPITQAFETIATAKVSRSAAEARALGYLRPQDGITMNRDRLLADAKARALALVPGYQPPAPPVEIRLPGPSARVAMELAVDGLKRQGKATAHDATVAGRLAEVLSGGATDITRPLTEDDLLALERRSFMALVRLGPTIARIEHMLETGKPLRN